MSRMTDVQIAVRLRDKLIDVINDQRKKDKKTGRNLAESNNSIVHAMLLMSADIMVNVVPPGAREIMDDCLKIHAEHLKEVVHDILRKEAQ
jgi:hypothetical protein